MARSRFLGMTILCVALVLSHRQLASAQTGLYPQKGHGVQLVDPLPPIGPPVAPAECVSGATCVVYPLAELGHDTNLPKWLAETIPNMIQPGTWNQGKGTKITYYAPAKVLVVYHTPAVHTQVKAFLGDLKKAVPLPLNRGVVQAEHIEPAPRKGPTAASSAGAGYPVPAPLQAPKHLFHLIIRYEGDGLSDETMAGLVKSMTDAAADKADGGSKKAEPAKGPSLGQLLHFIVRYEGEGIIDSNVAALVKDLYGGNAKEASRGWIAPAPPTDVGGPTSYGARCPEYELPGIAAIRRATAAVEFPVTWQLQFRHDDAVVDLPRGSAFGTIRVCADSAAWAPIIS